MGAIKYTNSRNMTFSDTRRFKIIFFSSLITFPFMVEATRPVTQIKSHCGQLSVKGFLDCKIEHNDQVISYIGPNETTVSGLRLGLITYKCDNLTGYMISELDCEVCGFHCSQEEHDLERQQENVQFWAGVVSGLLLSCVVGGLIGFYFFKFLNARFLDIQCFRRKQGVDTEEKVSMTSIEVSENTEEKASKASYGEPSAEKEGRQKVKNFFPRVKKSMSGFITSLLFVETVNACDWTFLVGHDNLTMVCNENLCQNSPPAAFSVAVGQKVCFEDHFGGVVSLTVDEITYKSRYELVYYTSHYITNITTKTCMFECQPTCGHTTLLRLNDEVKENSTDIHHQGWACDEVSFYDGNYGRSDHHCCRYFWEVTQTGDLYPVYTEVGQAWIANVTISQNDSVRQLLSESQLVLDAYSSSFDLTGFKLDTTNKLTFTVTNAEVTNLRPASSRSILLYGEKFYYIDASDVKKPRNGLFGDIQIPIAKNRIIFAPPEEACHPPSPSSYISRYNGHTCNCDCSFPSSRISTFANSSHEFIQSNNFVIRNNYTIVDTFEKYVAGNLSLKPGPWKIEDSAVKEAKCDFEHVLSYSCPSCNATSYIVLIPRNIVKEGIVPFYSNCSFDRRMLRCGLAEPMKLVLRGSYGTCLVKMPTLRQNILLDVESKNIMRKVYPVKKVNMTVMTYGDTLTHLVTSDEFIDAFTNTLLFFLGLFIVVVLGVISYKVLRSKRKAEGNTDSVLISSEN